MPTLLMPDHFHILITPKESLEKAIQNIKGGFSYRAKNELNWQGEVWEKGFTDHRIRDMKDWMRHLDYIRMNPVKANLCNDPEEYLYGAHTGTLLMDRVPQRLKPLDFGVENGGAEAPPLQEMLERK